MAQDDIAAQLLKYFGLRGWEAPPTDTAVWGAARRRPFQQYEDDMIAAPYGYYPGGSFGAVEGGGGGVASGNVGGASLASFAAPSFSRFAASPDVGGAGAFEPGSFSGSDEGLNAVSPTFGDWIGSFATPVGGLMSLAGQALYNGITGQPNKPITNVGLGSLFGGGSDAATTNDVGSSSINAGLDIANRDYAGAALDLAGAVPDVGYQGSGQDVGTTPGDPTGGEGPGALAKGGPVRRHMLAGPNPPGPDDGLAYLDAGEHVVTARDVRRIGGHQKLADLIRRKAKRDD